MAHNLRIVVSNAIHVNPRDKNGVPLRCSTRIIVHVSTRICSL